MKTLIWDKEFFKSGSICIEIYLPLIYIFFRTATARGKAELADMAADQAREDFEIARNTAKQFAPDFNLPSNCLIVLFQSIKDVTVSFK